MAPLEISPVGQKVNNHIYDYKKFADNNSADQDSLRNILNKVTNEFIDKTGGKIYKLEGFDRKYTNIVAMPDGLDTENYYRHFVTSIQLDNKDFVFRIDFIETEGRFITCVLSDRESYNISFIYDKKKGFVIISVMSV